MRESTDTAAAPTAAQAERSNGAPPRLSAGVEVMGELQGSGFREPAFLLRRADGQVIQLPHLLYLVATEMDGRRVPEEIAERVTRQSGRGVDANSVRFLVEERLRPLGIVQSRNGHGRVPRKPDPLLALSWRKAVLPARHVRALTTIFRTLFNPAVVAAVVAGFAVLDAWLFFDHGISQAMRGVIYQPALLLVMFAAVVAGTAFHEIGHATGCRYGGAKPGPIGVGLYVVWPVFYSDVTDAYRLGRAGRLRTDLGGVYFNAIFALAVGGAYFATGYEPLLLLVAIQSFAILQQLLPLGRLDGYLILSDLTGVPDILSRVKPVLRSLVPWRQADQRVRELRPWARAVTSAYVLIVIPVLLFAVCMMILFAPRVFATAYDSLGVRYEQVSAALDVREHTTALAGLLQMAALVAPCVGIAATTIRVGRRLGSATLIWSAGAPLRQAAVGVGTAAAATLASFTWVPNGEYRPIQAQERGTVQGGVASLREIPSGRPSLPRGREIELHGAPTARERLRREPEPAAASSRSVVPALSSPVVGDHGLGERNSRSPFWWKPRGLTPVPGQAPGGDDRSPPETAPGPQGGADTVAPGASEGPGTPSDTTPSDGSTPSDTTSPGDTTTAPSDGSQVTTPPEGSGDSTAPSEDTASGSTTTEPADGTTTDTTTTPQP